MKFKEQLKIIEEALLKPASNEDIVNRNKQAARLADNEIDKLIVDFIRQAKNIGFDAKFENGIDKLIVQYKLDDDKLITLNILPFLTINTIPNSRYGEVKSNKYGITIYQFERFHDIFLQNLTNVNWSIQFIQNTEEYKDLQYKHDWKFESSNNNDIIWIVFPRINERENLNSLNIGSGIGDLNYILGSALEARKK